VQCYSRANLGAVWHRECRLPLTITPRLSQYRILTYKSNVQTLHDMSMGIMFCRMVGVIIEKSFVCLQEAWSEEILWHAPPNYEGSATSSQTAADKIHEFLHAVR